MKLAGCTLCETEDGMAVFRGDSFHVVQAALAALPAAL